MQQREVKKLPTLRGKTVVNLFFEDSTRTRISFEAAAKRLSADVINFSRQGLERLEGREPARTPRRPCRRWARTPSSSATARPALRAPSRRAAGSTRASSTPATARTSTRRRRCSTRSRSASACTARHPRPRPRRRARRRSSATSCTRASRGRTCGCSTTLGAEVTLVAPPTLVPRRRLGAGRRRVGYDLDAALADAPDVVMMLRIQAERMNAAYLPQQTGSMPARWGLDDAPVRRARPRYDGHAPRPDEPRAGDLRRAPRIRRGRRCSSRSRTASRCEWPCSTCCCRATTRGDALMTRAAS